MSFFTSKIYLIIISILFTTLCGVGLDNYFTSKENKLLNESLIKEELKYTILKEDLEMANAEIEENETTFKEWKKQKPKIKYKTIYKFKEGVKDATCDEKVKAIADINFSDL